MVFRRQRKVFRDNTMTAAAAAIGRIPQARVSVPERIGVSVRAVEGWLQGTSQPSWENFIAMFQEFDEFADAVLQATGRANSNLTHEQRRKLLSILGEP